MSLVCYARIRLSSRLTRALIARRHNSTTNSSLIEDVSVPRQESPPQKPENDAVTLSRKVLERGKIDTSRITKTLFELLDNPPEEPEAAEQETVSKKKKKKKKNAAALAEKAQGNVSVKPVVEGVVEKPEQGKVKAKDTKPNEGKKKDFPLYSRRLEGLLEEKEQQVLTDLEPITKQSPISVLAHGLDRVLFNPGVHWLRDPRSRVYNFHPVLETIPKVFDFAFERLTGFVRSSRDQDLWSLARREGRQFGGSTSSLSGMLSQIYFLISENKGVDTSTLSKDFSKQPTTFTPGQRMAASVVFNHNDGVYAIDSDPTKVEETEKNILTWMGTLLEKYLTMNTEEFLAYMRTQPRLVIEDEKVTDEETREAYRYSKSNKFVMRSQLDCHDSRLPGTGVFDIKTRACMPIRMDILNFEESSGYLITKQQGLLQSFEREYYDLIRSAFLKYSFQARIGNMDGVFVAYHNTARMFGFQYVPLEEMDQRLFSEVPGVGDRVFQKCVELLEVVVDEIIACFPGQSVKCTFETRQAGKDMDVWVEPAEWDRLDKPKPIKQLCVNARSFLGNTPVKGDVAVRGAHETWTLHWTVTHMHASEETVRQNLKRAKERQFRAYTLPTGIDHSQIEDWWNGLNFSGKPLPESVVQSSQESIKNETESPAASDSLETKPNDSVPVEKDAQFFSDNFTEPDKGILALRRIARRGREISQQLAEEEKGKPKIVLGVGEVYVDESIWDRVDDKADNVVGSQSS